jgi:hypothetical protein
MHTYMEIKSAAYKILNDRTANEATKQLALALATLAERTMKLEDRYRHDIERLEKTRKSPPK